MDWFIALFNVILHHLRIEHMFSYTKTKYKHIISISQQVTTA